MDLDGIPALPDDLTTFSRADVDAQRVMISLDAWEPLLSQRPDLLSGIAAEVDAGGIRRSFVHARADGDPVELFLAAMAWGFGPVAYGPSRVTAMMSDDSFESKVAAIVADTRNRGAGDGWTSLLRDNKVKNLGMAYGTKLLYFAGFRADCPGPRPLVLDQFVRAALVRFGAQVPARGTVWRADYERYLAIAETWAADSTWNADPDVVEYGLFELGKRPDPVSPEVDDDDTATGAGEHGPG